MLAIYLTPVLVLVCLIGVGSIAAGGVRRVAMKVGGRLARGNGTGSAGAIAIDRDKKGPRLAYRHQRSQSPR